MIIGTATALEQISCLKSIFFPSIAFQALLLSELRIYNRGHTPTLRRRWFFCLVCLRSEFVRVAEKYFCVRLDSRLHLLGEKALWKRWRQNPSIVNGWESFNPERWTLNLSTFADTSRCPRLPNFLFFSKSIRFIQILPWLKSKIK